MSGNRRNKGRISSTKRPKTRTIFKRRKDGTMGRNLGDDCVFPCGGLDTFGMADLCPVAVHERTEVLSDRNHCRATLLLKVPKHRHDAIGPRACPFTTPALIIARRTTHLTRITEYG